MDCYLENKLNELYNLLDNLEYIKILENIKANIDDELRKNILDYHNNPTILNKHKLYENPVFCEYIKNEQQLNYLVMQINSKFSIKRGKCENNKW